MSPEKPTRGQTRQKIRQQIQQHQLSEEQLKNLMTLQADRKTSATDPAAKDSYAKRFFKHSLITAALAASLMITIGISHRLSLLTWEASPHHTQSQHQHLLTAIAEEVVKNHLKLKPLDVETQSIQDAQEFFQHLDFRPVNSLFAERTYSLNRSELLGGRYCSIQGITAAQLRYTGQQNTLNTLYQVPYNSAAHGNIPNALNNDVATQLTMKGLTVRLWQERGLLMVLVSSH